MNSYVGAVALIPDRLEGSPRWLVRRDPKTREPKLISAERLEGESYRHALDRELAWQLGLPRGKGFLISSAPRLHVQSLLCMPEPEGQKFFLVEFYQVSIYGQQYRDQLTSDADNLWWSTTDLLNSELPIGERLIPWQQRLLKDFEVLPPHL